jgi:hypothetical protein
LRREHEREARLLELQTKYLVSATYAATGGKGARSAAKGAAKQVSFLPPAPVKRKPQPIPTELALATFGEPLIPMTEE